MKNSFLFLLLLVILTGCDVSQHQQVKNMMATDSLWASTGDTLLDSLLQVSATAPQDTNLARLYFDIGELYVDAEPSKAKDYYLKLRMLSDELNWNKGYYLFAAGYTDVLNREGLTDSSMVIHQQALELAKEERNELQIAKISTNIGNCFNYKKWFETALKYYNDALPIFEKRGEKYMLAHLYYLIGVVHNDMNMQNENLMYCEKAVRILNEKPDTLPRAYVLINYAVALLTDWQIEKAENALLEAQRICMLRNSRYNLISIYSNLGDIALKKFDWDQAEIYARKALELALEFGELEGYCISNRALAYVEEYRGNFDKSEKYVMEALETANEFDLPVEKMKCYLLLSDLATARHNFRNFRLHAAKADSIQNTLINEQSRLYAKEMEAKYETEKKELKITALEERQRLITWLSISAGLMLSLALMTALFLWRWTVQKRMIAEQRIRQLEQEKQIIASQALLDGETQERTRLARDLHDGLGSILAGAKLNLLEMKKGAVLEYASLERFDTAVGLIERSVNEMRRVAHHLMPESLTAAGLKQAATDFMNSIPHATFNYYGD